jgi:hypothetical protein
MGLFGWAKPGNDRQLAADITTQRRNQRSRSATRADRQGQAWEDRDRRRDRKGDRQTNWN